MLQINVSPVTSRSPHANMLSGPRLPGHKEKLMPLQLTDQDKDFVWQVVMRASERFGGHAQMFSNPLEFDDVGGRIRFHWPDWMQEIRTYIIAKYGEKDAQSLLLDVFTEVMSRDQFERRQQLYLQEERLGQNQAVWR